MTTIGDQIASNRGLSLRDKEVFDKIMSQKLVINRVPKKTKDVFIKLSKDEFGDDYGMTLLFLVDYFLTDAKYMDLLNRVSYLEQKQNAKQNDKPKEIKTLGGVVIKRKGEIK